MKIAIAIGILIIGFIIFAFISSAYGVEMTASVPENECNKCLSVCQTH
jgi:hypothetical protein